MFKDVSYSAYLNELLKQLPKGLFLTTVEGNRSNVMTIGWGNIGIIWGKPIFTVLVRYSRFSFDLINASKEFAVNIPLTKNLQKELGFCGSKSGKDIDKLKECGLTTEKAKIISVPIIKECDLFYECRVLYQQAMEPELLDNSAKKAIYPNKDYHVLYYGEIVASYISNE